MEMHYSSCSIYGEIKDAERISYLLKGTVRKFPMLLTLSQVLWLQNALSCQEGFYTVESNLFPTALVVSYPRDRMNGLIPSLPQERLDKRLLTRPTICVTLIQDPSNPLSMHSL